MKPRIWIALMLLSIILLSGCSQESDLSAVLASDMGIIETEEPAASPEVTPEQGKTTISSSESKEITGPMASPTPTVVPVATPTTKPSSPSETPKAIATPEPSQAPKPTNSPKPEKTPSPVATPVPTATPKPTHTPSPTPAPSTGRTICNTCGADITGKVAVHGDSHLLNGENFSYRVE